MPVDPDTGCLHHTPAISRVTATAIWAPRSIHTFADRPLRDGGCDVWEHSTRAATHRARDLPRAKRQVRRLRDGGGKTAVPHHRRRVVGASAPSTSPFQTLGELGELPLSPSLTFGAVAARRLADFEAKVAIGNRSERTLDLYRSQLRLHLRPRLTGAGSRRSCRTMLSQLLVNCSRVVWRPGRSSESSVRSAAF
jgi:hypothetical protein